MERYYGQLGNKGSLSDISNDNACWGWVEKMVCPGVDPSQITNMNIPSDFRRAWEQIHREQSKPIAAETFFGFKFSFNFKRISEKLCPL